MQACREGGQSLSTALRRLLADYGHALQREGTACVGNEDDARDLVQSTLIKAWERCSGFRGESELFPWLKSVLRHAAIDHLRRRRPEQALDDETGRCLPEVEAALQALGQGWKEQPLDALEQRRLDDCFKDCASRFARAEPLAASVVRWISEDGLSPAEVAPLLGRSPGATREFISQCRKKARPFFAAWYALVSPTASVS